jgi:hypothetical protein
MTTTETSPAINTVNIEAVAGLAAKIQESPEVASTTWKAAVTWEQGFRSTASIRDFAPIGSDEPAGLGGTDTAPNPVEQLLAALGNCLAVGYAANATAAGVAINDLRIELEGDLDLHTFLGLNPGGNAGFQGIRQGHHRCRRPHRDHRRAPSARHRDLPGWTHPCPRGPDPGGSRRTLHLSYPRLSQRVRRRR